MEKPDPGDALAWSVRPFSEERGKGVAVVVFCAGAGATALGGPILGGIALLLLAGGLGPFYARTRYRLTPEGVEVQSAFQRVRRPWSGFRRAHVGRRGVSLSPFPGHHVFEPYRSVLLRFGPHRDEVLAWVRRFGPGEEGRT